MKSSGKTDTGNKRSNNQDSIFFSDTSVGPLPNLYIVADGMGGHKAGDRASKMAIDITVDFIKKSSLENPIAVLKRAMVYANNEIYKAANSDVELNGMGTTMVAAVVLNDKLIVANVGDSRLYVMNKEIEQITRDHSLVEEMVQMGGIDRASARLHPDKNLITRAIGVQETIEIDFFQVELKEGDIILMCSDGLTNMLEDEDIRMILAGQRDIVEKAEELVKAANENGGMDNIAVILIKPCMEGEEAW